jgi:VWFA-related protein
MIGGRAALAAVLLASATLAAQEPAPQFRAATHGVVFDAAVFDGDRVVADLKPSDFDVIDNGARQTLTTADFNRLPIDLRLVFDTSGSISDEELERYLKTMQRVASGLDKKDRCEIVTFTTKLAEAAARQFPPLTVNLARNGPEGTAFFDAALAALITVPVSDRRQMTVLLSDAIDNASFFDEAAMWEAARRTDAVVYTVLPGDPMIGRAVSVSRLQSLSLLTGGRLVRTPAAYVAGAVTDAIQEFRQSYTLRYNQSGTKWEGWHKLEVKVRNRSGVRVRTKLGYFGG